MSTSTTTTFDADFAAFLDDVALGLSRQEPSYYYTRWIDDTPAWQFVDTFLKTFDWSTVGQVQYLNRSTDTEANAKKYMDSMSVVNKLMTEAKKVLSADDLANLEDALYCTELDDAVGNYHSVFVADLMDPTEVVRVIDRRG